MIRFQIPVLLAVACNCAAPKAERPPAPDALLTLLAGLGDSPSPAPDVCPGVIQVPWSIMSNSVVFEGQLDACSDRVAVVEIDSTGGAAAVGLDMAKKIERHPHPVYCLVDGMAASAAFDILQSCDLRFMTARSRLMQHNASKVLTAGETVNETELRNAHDNLAALDEGRALHCARRMGWDVEAYKAKIAGGREWWMTQAQALDAGAVDFPATDLSEVVRLAAEVDGEGADGGR